MKTGKRYWQSVEDAAGTPKFNEWLHREFPEAAAALDSVSRRTMFKLMAASFGLAGLAACSRPVERILPAAKATEGYVPGQPLFYATAMALGGSGTGLLVEAHEGRPTKVEGNPGHPFSRGAASAFAQASVLSLYDPDRTRGVLRGSEPSSWDEFFAWARDKFAEAGDGAKLRFLSQTVHSPSLDAIRRHALSRYPKARWVEYEPLMNDNALEGAEIALGRRLQPQYQFDKADVIVSLDSDFLGLDAAAITHITDFARRRGVGSEVGRAVSPVPQHSMNRLYVVESQFSITGGMADHRRRMRVGDVREFAAELGRELGLLPAGLKVVSGSPEQGFVAAVARDLTRHAGRSLVLAGPRQPAVVHALAHWMNESLGNVGSTVAYTETALTRQVDGLRQLADEMGAGAMDTLVILGGNPAYDAPADLSFAAAMGQVANSIHLAPERNETAALAAWRLPEAHYLETWGDVRAIDGTATVQQPLIQPLFGGKSAAEVAAALTGYKDLRSYDIVRNYWQSQWPAVEAESRWHKCLNDGVIPDTACPLTPVSVNAAAIKRALSEPRPSGSGIELTFYPSASTWDGRFANNGWLQEAPDPITKLTWDNAALMSPATARKLGVENGDLIALSAGGRTVEAPVWIQPGHADDAVSLALGYGRRQCGRVGRGVGHNAYPLRTTDGLWRVEGVRVGKTGRKYPLSTTQEHHRMEGREPVREATLDEYRRRPGVIEKGEPLKLFSIYGEHDYTQGNQWGMVVDLNACIGCNACVLACQAENNIPIVGKDQVARGREMHWIRMDRYYTGPDEDPQSVTQPVACMQCENAPCESVCPVAATTHSPEGLNDMAYNRCVGTRYCANNCPYKVRRFNFLDWHKGVEDVEKMAFNPDVTVRMRGVMEKCTYCVQRVQETKIRAKQEGRREIRDGEIKTACQQTCPAEAIVFGNLNDPNSRVARLQKSNRQYKLLGELNTCPRTTYLAKLRNPNPEVQEKKA